MSAVEHLQHGRYTILKKIGEGGRGQVYKARDTVLDRVVAIKVLKSTLQSEEAYSRFIREAQAVARLNHPNIVSIYDVGKEGETQFLVLEYVDGGCLSDLIATYPEHRCDVPTVLRVCMDMCSALQYAHSQGILHRDIKPQNIMITQEGTAKLMDFGLAKMLGQPELTQEGVIVGTVAYLAPEIALGKSVDARSDLYSFGAVLYEALTGKPPFVGDDPVKIIFSHIHDYPVPPSKANPSIPQPLSECTIKLLEKDPERRYSSAADLLKSLREITDGLSREVLTPYREPSRTVPSARPIGSKEIRLVDRDEEMAILREVVDRTVGGEGRLVFLHGEAGIGKTRLTRELGTYARLRGMRVLHGRCPALFHVDGIPPYSLWSETIKDYLEFCTPDQLYRVMGFYPSEVSKLVPEIKQRLGAIPPSLPIGPEHERDRLFEAVSQFIANVSKETPLVVVLDDLQWTDQTSLLLLDYLGRGVHRTPLLIVGAYRESDIDEKHPLFSVMTDLNRERVLQSISLKRMSYEEVSEMIKRILEQEDIPGEFSQLIYARTRGNPFFVEEVIRCLKEEGTIRHENNRWKIEQISRIEFPDTVKSVLKARIGRIDEECQNALTLASFIGNNFTFEALLAVTGIQEDKLLGLMDRIIRTGMVKENVIRGEDVYSFEDAVVRDLLHEEVSHLRHKKLHTTVGTALERAYASTIDQHFGELGYHFLEGGDKERALDYFMKAAEKATGVYAHQEAISYLKQALVIIEGKGGNTEERARLTETLGNLEAWIGETDACMAYWSKSLELWNQAGDRRSVARLHVAMAKMLWEIGDKEKATEHHNGALQILEQGPETVELAGLYEDISHMLWRTGESAKALPFANKGLELAEKLASPQILADSYNNLGVMALYSGQTEKAKEHFEQGLKIATENNCTRAALRLYHNLSAVYEAIGGYQVGFEAAEKAFELSRKFGLIYQILWTGINLAGYHLMRGEMQVGLNLAEEMLSLSKRTKNAINEASAMVMIALFYGLSGDWEKSTAYFTESYALAKKTGDYQIHGFSAYYFGWLFLEMGNHMEAEKYLNESRRIFETAHDDAQLFPFILPVLSQLYLEKGEVDKARELIERISGYGYSNKNPLITGIGDCLKAMLFREQCNLKQSLGYFEKSLQEYRTLDLQETDIWTYCQLLYDYGLFFLKRNEEGDMDRAFSFLDQALEIYHRVGAKKRIERIVAKKKLMTA